MTASSSLLGFTMQLPVQAQSTLVAQPWERAAGPAELAAVTRACDVNGFYSVSVCDHVAIPRERAPTMSTTWYDTVATLGWLAGFTAKVRLLSHVYVVAYRHPLQTAKAFATLDALSGGRAILGVGAGHVEGEFDALEVPFKDRGRLTDEAIDAITVALTDEWPEHAGARWSFKDLGQRPRPVQEPRPPIWIGGYGKPALRRVAARGDGWIPQGTPRAQLRDDIAYILRHAEETRPGARPEMGFITETVYVGEPNFDIGRYSVSGSPQRLVDSFNELGEMGVSHLQLRFASRSASELCEQVAAFGADVGPHLVRRSLS